MKKRSLILLTALLLVLAACAAAPQPPQTDEAPAAPAQTVSWDALSFDRTMPLQYANKFSVIYAVEDYTRITIGDDQTFLLVAEGADVPSGIPDDATVLQLSLIHISEPTRP